MLGGGARTPAAPERIADAPPWPEAERLAFEKESLGFFISGHPLERFRAELAQWASADHRQRSPQAGRAGEVTVGGIVTALRLIKTKKGDRMASFLLEDLEGSVEALVFPETYKKAAGRLADDQVVLVKGEGRDPGRRARRAARLRGDAARAGQAGRGALRDDPRAAARPGTAAKGERLRDILGAHRGDCPVTLELVRPGSWAVALRRRARTIACGPDAVLRDEIEALLGEGALVLDADGEPGA